MNPGANATRQRSPLNAYRALLRRGAIQEDAGQANVVLEFDRLWQALEQSAAKGWLDRFRASRRPPPRGIYLWGSVGRGKTWLMDLFLEQLHRHRYLRTHFHRFMARVHDGLKRHHDARDPLELIAREWSAECDLLCFDEFFVSDIADAMLLGGLLEALIDRGVILVATSNVPPDELYRDGLQRARFLPAIDCIKQHCAVVELAGSEDHRLRILESAGVYHDSASAEAETALERRYLRLSGNHDLNPRLNVNGRTLGARRRGLGIVWFDFAELCRKPRSSQDYIELALGFNTVLLSQVPVMRDDAADAARRFIALVDEFYDRNVKLIVSAAAPPEELYLGERLAFEYRRTASRLIEMQSHDYLARPHLP